MLATNIIELDPPIVRTSQRTKSIRAPLKLFKTFIESSEKAAAAAAAAAAIQSLVPATGPSQAFCFQVLSKAPSKRWFYPDIVSTWPDSKSAGYLTLH